MYGLYGFTQFSVWNTWGPISAPSMEAFGWDTATIAWLANWGPVAFLMVGLLYPWLLQVKGLRWAVVSSVLLVALGSSLRIITSEPETATVLIYAAQFLNGLAGPIAMGGVTAISSLWFPPHERITATAVGNSLALSGMAASFVLGPALVSEGPPDNRTSNSSFGHSFYLSYPHSASVRRIELSEASNVTNSRIHTEREEIMGYMYYSCGWAWLLALCVLCYYPATPPHPPCHSATVERDHYWAGLWSLRNKGYFLVVALIYGVSLGVLNCWSSLLSVNLKAVNVSESSAGWIGCYSTVVSCLFALFIGKFADYFTRSLKVFILILYILGTGCFTVFALMLIKVIPYSDALLYTTIIAGMALLNGAVPLMFELACELAYPTSEGAANGFLAYINNIGGVTFLAVFSIPDIGTMWMNWALIGACAVCVPLIIVLRGRFNRLDVDERACLDKEATFDPPSRSIQT